jgi:hypothetical protein
VERRRGHVGAGWKWEKRQKKTVRGGEADEGSTEGRTKTVRQTAQTLPSSYSRDIWKILIRCIFTVEKGVEECAIS